jgi:RNA polymerase sigma-70 factor, ECF subfamily
LPYRFLSARTRRSRAPRGKARLFFGLTTKSFRIGAPPEQINDAGLRMETVSSLSIEELLRQCSIAGSGEAWEEFVRRFHRLIATVAMRTADRLGDSSKQTVDDLIQQTYLKLCDDNFRVLRNFQQQHRDAFIGYIKVVTANVVRDHFKAAHSEKRGANRVERIMEEFIPPAGDGSAGSPKAIERAVLIQEINHQLDLCVLGPDQERNNRIFWLYYRAGLSARAIASLPGMGLTAKGVESIIARITKDLRQRMVEPKGAESARTSGAGEGILRAQSF